MPNVVAIIQARLGSERFPRKVLEDIGGKPMFEHVVDRATQIRGVDNVVLAVPVGEWELLNHGYGLTSGSEHDVLDRYLKAAIEYRADIIVRLTADCPLFCPVLGGDVVEKCIDMSTKARRYIQNGFEHIASPVEYAYVGTGTTQSGFEVEAFTRQLLGMAARDATGQFQREHVTPWMQTFGTWDNRATLYPPEKPPNLRLTVDTPEDLKLVRKVYDLVKDRAPTMQNTVAAWREVHNPTRKESDNAIDVR